MPIEPAVSGTNVLQARKALEKHVGVEPVARAIAQLAPKDREIYLGVTALSWVPLRIVEDATRLYAVELGWTPEKVVRETARLAVIDLMNGLWRVILRFTTDQALVSRTPLIYGKTYNVGALTSEIPEPGKVRLELTGWPSVPDLQLIGLGSGIETVLACAGRKAPRLTWKRTPDGAEYRGSWRV